MALDKLYIIKSAIKANVPLLLEGHTGTGKTYTIMKLAEELGKTLHVINVSGELTVDSILGQQSLIEGNVTWHDGVLTTAMKNGDWVLFDEMNTALPEVMTVINGVLDDSRSVTLPNRENERVVAHAEFRFIGTQNPASGDYAGTAKLNSALLNRMMRVEFEYMEPEAEVNALKEHTSLKDGTLSVLVSIANYTRFDDSGFSHNPLSTRDLVKILRLRDDGGMKVDEALSLIAKDKYTENQYDILYSRFSNKMYELEKVLGCRKHEDPFEKIVKKQEELNRKERELVIMKANMRDEVRKEILQEVLKGISKTASMPEGF